MVLRASPPRGTAAFPAALRRGASTAATYFGFSGGTAGSPGGGKRTTSWRALASPAFRRYFAGCVTSDLGTWLASTAQLLLVYRLSHSVLVIGLISCAQFSSPLLLGPWAGAMTDRLGGRRTLLLTQLLGTTCAAAMASLIFAGLISPWWLGGGAIATGIAFTLALPARNVTVRGLVREADVEPAFAMDSVSYNLGRAVGPPLTVGLLMLSGDSPSGYGWAFAANAVSFLAFAGCLLAAGKGSPRRPGQRPAPGPAQRPRERPEGLGGPERLPELAAGPERTAGPERARSPEGAAGPGRATGPGRAGGPGRARPPERSGLRAGLAAARDDWRIAVLLAMVAAVTVADDPVLVLGPALAHQQQVLHTLPGWLAQWLSPENLPGLFIAALGSGTVLGSLRPSRHRAGLRVPAVALALLAACMMVFVLSPWSPLSVAAAAGAGFSVLAANSSTRALLSSLAARRGCEASVMVVWAIAWAGSKPVASLADGTIADSLGVKWAGVLLALPALVPVLAMIALMIGVYVAVRSRQRQFPGRRRHRAARSRHLIAAAPGRWLAAFQAWLVTPAFHRADDLLTPPASPATADEAS